MTIAPPNALLGFLLTVLLCPSALHAQQQTRAGPVIESAGAVFSVDPDMSTPRDRDYRLAFEVAAPSASVDQVNTGFNSVARFLVECPPMRSSRVWRWRSRR